jgi:germination protein M
MVKSRSLMGILTTLMLVIAFVPASAAQVSEPGGTFIDDNGNVHEGFIEAIAAEDIARGCNPPDNDWYCPDDPVTRGEMAAFLTRALELEPSGEDSFVDDDGSVFESDIESLAAAGITRGCNPPDNAEFCPASFVTRGEMAAFLVRAFDYEDTAGETFVDDDASEFESDIERLAAAGVTRGCNPPDNDRFCPDEPVLRDQMASFLGRALQLEPSTPAPAMVVAPFFFLDEDGHSGRTGPFLAPVHRSVAESAAVAEESIRSLLEGPTATEESSLPAVSSEIPQDTTLRSIVIDNGVAVIDLSGEFAASRPSASAAGRVAQVVFTLTRFDTVSSVVFLQEGARIEVPTGSGGVVDRAVSRDDYRAFEAAISVESPLYGGIVDEPVVVSGEAAVFGGRFSYALLDEDGRIVAEGGAIAGTGSGWSPFRFSIDHDLVRSQRGALVVWATASDGSRIDIREYPLILQPD